MMRKNPAKEIEKCKSDIVYFAENYFHVQYAVENEIKLANRPVKLNNFQKSILRKMQRAKKISSIAERGYGKTTVCCIYVLWKTLFFENQKTILFVSNKQRKDFCLSVLNEALIYLPPWIWKSMDRSVSNTFLFPNTKSSFSIESISFLTFGNIMPFCTNFLVDEFSGLNMSETYCLETVINHASFMKAKIFILSSLNQYKYQKFKQVKLVSNALLKTRNFIGRFKNNWFFLEGLTPFSVNY